MVISRALLRLGHVQDAWPRDELNPIHSTPRTAILLPSGCRFSAQAPNSMETVVRTLAGAVDHRNIRIFCCEGADDHGSPEVETLPAGNERRSALIRKVAVFRPDIVEHHQQVKQAMAIAAALPRAAHILYRHNALKPPLNVVDRWRYNARYGGMDGFVFVSEAERRLFARSYPRHADRAWAIPNPIDARLWLAPVENREPVIAFAGRAMPEKGVDVICAALPGILDRHAGWRAVLMLNDWDRHGRWAEPHIAPLERYGARVSVFRSAPLSQVQGVMKSAAIALTPSVWDEPFGLTAVEAHAAGAALISSGRGGLREASGPHALFLNEVTPAALAEAIERLIGDPEERVARARAAQRFVLDEHSPERRAAELLQVRQTVILRRSARNPLR